MNIGGFFGLRKPKAKIINKSSDAIKASRKKKYTESIKKLGGNKLITVKRMPFGITRVRVKSGNHFSYNFIY